MDRMQLKAMAKINLGLDVLRRREDGYHEVRMVMQTVHILISFSWRRGGKKGSLFGQTFIIFRRMRIIWFIRLLRFCGRNFS